MHPLLRAVPLERGRIEIGAGKDFLGVVAMAIIAERFWTLQRRRIAPEDLVLQVWQWAKAGQLNEARIRDLRTGSPLGRILAAGLVNRDQARELMKEAIEDVGRHVVHELERYLETLGTVAAVSPLLGLLGTVIGMVERKSKALFQNGAR